MRLLRLASAVLLMTLVAAQRPSEGALWLEDPFHWARDSRVAEIGYVVEYQTEPGHWPDAIARASGAWGNLSRYGIDDVARFEQDPSQPLVSITIANYGPTGWMGLASTYKDTLTRHVVDGTIRLNEYYFTGVYDRMFIRQRIACHELGHILGLGHAASGAAPSCMSHDTSTYRSYAYRDPGPDDALTLDAIYTHRDLATHHLAPSRPAETEVVPAG